MRNFIKVLKCKRGQAMVEMALAIPVFMLVLMGIIDLGRVIHEQQELTAAAREGARRAAVTQSDLAATTAVTQMATGLNFAPGDIAVTWSDNTNRASRSTVTVTASSTPQIFYSKIAEKLSQAAGGGTFRLTGTAVMRVE